jgi:AcrR family transcriptional regulator
MAPRPYDRRRRDEAMAAMRERITAAIADLHAEIGPSRTTYAVVARRADVAIPTVYKHFPTLAGMFAACIGHVSARAPALTGEVFAGAATAAERLARLVPALFERHRFFAPWLRWSTHEAHLLPDMAIYFTKMRERHLRLVHEALAPDFGPRPPRALVALVEALTAFETWQTMTAPNGLSSGEAASIVVDAITAALAHASGSSARSGGPALRRSRRGRARGVA